MARTLYQARQTLSANDTANAGTLALAEARDTLAAAGANIVTGGAVSLTTAAATWALAGTAPGIDASDDADFAARATAPGVFLVHDFNDATKLGPTTGLEPGVRFAVDAADDGHYPTISTTVKRSGQGSLKFTIPTLSTPNCAGTWGIRLSADDLTQYGENSTLAIQWAEMWDANLCATTFLQDAGAGGGPQTGIKSMTVGGGRLLNGSAYYGGTHPNEPGTSSLTKIVCTTHNSPLRFKRLYNGEAGSSTSFGVVGANAGLYGSANTETYQTEIPVCSYVDSSGCFSPNPDEWVTYQMLIEIGARRTGGAENAWDARVRLYGSRYGQGEILLHDYKSTLAGYHPLSCGTPAIDEKLGKVWFDVYMTAKERTQNHATCAMYIDELIVGTQKIPAPAVYPTWRQGKVKDTWYQIASTAGMAGATNVNSASIDAWNGLAPAGTVWYSILASGDGEWRNGAHKIDLSANVPAWATLYSGVTLDPLGKYSVASPAPNGSPVVYDSPYYLTNGAVGQGTPVGRHTYWQTWYDSSRSRVFAMACNSAYGINTPGTTFDHGPEVDAFRLDTNVYDPVAMWPSQLLYERLMAYAQNPDTGDVFAVGGAGKYVKWTRSAGTWQVRTPNLTLSSWLGDSSQGANGMPSLVDVRRNRLVGLLGGGVAQPVSNTLECINLANDQVTYISVTPLATTIVSGAGFVHDTDNDRYLYARQTGSTTQIYSINPDTGASALLNTVSDVPVFTGIFNRLWFFPTLGCVAYCSRYASNIWFMPTR